jgi:glycosyltransferase involved in cell wall biosynthesis
MTNIVPGGRLFLSKVAYRLRSSPRALFERLRRYTGTPGNPLMHLFDVWRTTQRLSDSYAQSHHPPTPAELDRQRAYTFTHTPLISLLMPTYNTPEPWLRAAIESIQGQTYPHWQLCIADDNSSAAHVAPLLRQYAQSDDRIIVTIRPENGHIAAASNTTLSMATGEYIALLDHDDALPANTLFEVARLLQTHPTADLIYTDEDKIDMEGRHTEPHFKPPWSPLLLLNCNYITHFAVMRRNLVQQVGGFRHEFIGSQDHDLFLRVTELTDSVYHIPKVLYGWRKIPTSAASGDRAKTYAYDASLRAVKDALKRRKLPATASRSAYPPFIRINWRTPAEASLAVIPLRQPSPRWVEKLGLIDGELVTPTDDAPLPQRLNEAAHRTQADYLLFVDPTLTPKDSDWRTVLLGHLQVPNATAVTGKIMRRNGTLASIGYYPGFALDGIHDVPHVMFTLNVLKDAAHHVPAATAHLLLISRQAFGEGFDTRYTSPLAGADLCLRLPGYTIYTPHTRWLAPRHWDPSPPPADLTLFAQNWPDLTPPPYKHHLTKCHQYAPQP